MNILIIEDEHFAVKRLSEILHQVNSSINIVGIADSIEQGVEWLTSNPSPDLIFSDIELADGVSFEIYKQVRTECPIVFCTAYNQYMMEAFDINAISYILKPINREQVARAIEKYHSMHEMFAPKSDSSIYANQIDKLLRSIKADESKHQKSTLIINSGEKIIPIPVEDVAFFYATSSVLQVTTVKGQTYKYNSTLDELEKQLDESKFYRASRQFIIARKSILSIERYFNRTLVVKLQYKTPERVNISRLKTKSFLEWMER